MIWRMKWGSEWESPQEEAITHIYIHMTLAKRVLSCKYSSQNHSHFWHRHRHYSAILLIVSSWLSHIFMKSINSIADPTDIILLYREIYIMSALSLHNLTCSCCWAIFCSSPFKIPFRCDMTTPYTQSHNGFRIHLFLVKVRDEMLFKILITRTSIASTAWPRYTMSERERMVRKWILKFHLVVPLHRHIIGTLAYFWQLDDNVNFA